MLGTLARVIATNPSTERICQALDEFCARCAPLEGFAVVLRDDDDDHAVFSRGSPGDVDLASQAITDASLVHEESDEGERIALPFFVLGRPVGATLISSAAPVEAAALERIEIATLYAGASIGNGRLVEIAERDALTGLHNRKALDQAIAREFRRGARSQKPLAVILADVDFFHAYNTAYGHLAGDICLQQVARAISLSIDSPSGFLARYGGEEFVVMLPGEDEASASRAAERIVQAVAALECEHRASSLGRVSVSVGIAATRPAQGSDPNELLSLADGRLYEAKSAGRNRFVAASTRSDGPAVRERFESRDNFPSYLTAFVGRDRESKELEQAFDTARLVTVVGTGGSGKTRLALHVGRRVASRYRDGARLIELATKRSRDEILASLTRTFGIREIAGADPFEVLLDELREKRALIVFDNCEHVVRACSEVIVRILAECPEIAVLATSREALRIPGEAVYRLRGLTASDAQALFSERAEHAPDLPPAERASVVRAICKHLDGLPLAIELVAVHAEEFGLHGLLSAIEQRGGGLGFSAFAKTTRQENLYHTIDWSYELLDRAQQRLLARLSVFAFGARLDAVRAICCDEALPAQRLDGALSDLESKSLIEIDPERTEFRMAEPTAKYARMRLENEGARALHERFLHWYVNRSAALALEAGDPVYQAALQAQPAEIENYMLALHMLVTEHEDVGAGAELWANLGLYLGRLGWYAEVRRWSLLVLANESHLEDALVARLYRVLSVAAYGQTDGDAAEHYSRKALAIYQRLGDELGTARSLQTIGSSLYIRANYAQAREIYTRCLHVYRNIGNEHAVAAVLANLAAVETDGYCNVDAALAYTDEAIALCRRIDPNVKLGATLLTRGQAFYARGDYARASEALCESEAIFERLHHPFLGMTLSIAARGLIRQRQLPAAKTLLRRAVQIYALAEAPHYVAYCVESFALLAVADAQWESAAFMAGFAQSYRQRHNDVRANVDKSDFDEVLQLIDAALGDPLRAAAFGRGSAAALPAVFREALLL